MADYHVQVKRRRLAFRTRHILIFIVDFQGIGGVKELWQQHLLAKQSRYWILGYGKAGDSLLPNLMP